ncbi:MAG: phosphoribosylformylglycinamidine cyclo-ligase [bacterium]
MTYKDAGVDIDAADQLVQHIRPLARSTFRKEVLTEIGGFGSAVAIDRDRFPDPLLVASTDGVGTKLRIAFELDRHDTIGIDLVAMSANDVLVMGAEPLFFLDYFATGKLKPDVARRVLSGIAEGCRMAGCALVGGETAEMPSFYGEGEYELAGFCVGLVNRDRVIDGKSIRPGDKLLGLASSGLHSNGYSLVRKLFSAERGYSLDKPVPGGGISLGEELLRPTRIYVRSVLALLSRIPVHGLVHITGGGFIENIPRILPPGMQAVLQLGRWPVPDVFRWIETEGKLPLEEMLRTFNYGIGMVLVLQSEHAEEALRVLREAGEAVYPLGDIAPREPGQPPVVW